MAWVGSLSPKEQPGVPFTTRLPSLRKDQPGIVKFILSDLPSSRGQLLRGTICNDTLLWGHLPAIGRKCLRHWTACCRHTPTGPRRC